MLTVALACSPSSPDDGGGDGGGTTASPDPSTTGRPGSTGFDSSSGTTAADTTGMADGSFIDTEGPGEPGECRFGQTCPDGGKCVPRSIDVPPHYNVCSPVVPDPVPAGGACTLHPYQADEPIDDCDVDHYCLPTDAETQTGLCVRLCGLLEGLGGRVVPETCARPEACEAYGPQNIAYVCFDRCDPLTQDCPEPYGCHVGEGDAVCLPSVGSLGPAAPCELVNECAPGLTCKYYAGACEGLGCCLPWCDTGVPDTCDAALAGSTCVSWDWQGQPPLPGHETLGVCDLP